MSACANRDELGGYVLGSLSPAEERAVDAHLRTCPACRRDHLELTGAVDLLALATEAPPDVPLRVRDRLLSASVRTRVRRRWAAGAAACVLLAAVAGGLAGWALAPAPAPEVAVPLEAEAPYGAQGWARLAPTGEGLSVHLALTDLERLPDPAVYEAWLYTVEGDVVSIGRLDEAEGDVEVLLDAPGELADYGGVWVTAEPDPRDPAHTGPTVVRAPLPE